jgi:pantoate--beta-alanine ligase
VVEVARPEELRGWIRNARARGKRIGFVPTMGYFHEGHLRLLDAARDRADVLVVSIFVNPLQFGAGEDLSRYPQDPDRDRHLASRRGVDCLFLPAEKDLYPRDPAIRIAPGPLGDVLEGAARPGHFAGVLTVVAKLFHLVSPDVAVFGRKDYQQALLVTQMVRDLDFGVEVAVVPTVRELDGLAMSSRNAYLDGDDRRSALALSRALRAVERAWRSGETDRARLEAEGLGVLDETPGVTGEYFVLVDPHTLAPAAPVTAQTVAAVAARVGPARLIDNIVLGEGFRVDATASS